jgi:hypothetical protein
MPESLSRAADPPAAGPPSEFHATALAASGEAILCFIAVPAAAMFGVGVWTAWQRGSSVLAVACGAAALFGLLVAARSLLALFAGSLRITLDAEGLAYRGAAGLTRVRWDEMSSLRRVRGDDEAAPDTLVLGYHGADGGGQTLRVNAAHLRPGLDELMRALEKGSGLREQE